MAPSTPTKMTLPTSRKVSARIQQFAEGAQFQLVETFAERLAALLMSEFGIRWLRLKLTKPGAVPAARGVGVEIERGCL